MIQSEKSNQYGTCRHPLALRSGHKPYIYCVSKSGSSRDDLCCMSPPCLSLSLCPVNLHLYLSIKAKTHKSLKEKKGNFVYTLVGDQGFFTSACYSATTRQMLAGVAHFEQKCLKSTAFILARPGTKCQFPSGLRVVL